MYSSDECQSLRLIAAMKKQMIANIFFKRDCKQVSTMCGEHFRCKYKNHNEIIMNGIYDFANKFSNLS